MSHCNPRDVWEYEGSEQLQQEARSTGIKCLFS